MSGSPESGKKARVRTAHDSGLASREALKAGEDDGAEHALTGPMPRADEATLAARRIVRAPRSVLLPPRPLAAVAGPQEAAVPPPPLFMEPAGSPRADQLPPASPRPAAALPADSPGLPPATPAAAPIHGPGAAAAPPAPVAMPAPAPGMGAAAVHQHLIEQQRQAAAADHAHAMRELQASQRQVQGMKAALAAQQKHLAELQQHQAAQRQAAGHPPRHIEIMSRLITSVLHWDRNVRDVFNSIDSNGDGALSTGEFRKAMERTGVQLSPQELAEVGQSYDKDKNGTLSGDEFVMMLIDFNTKLQERFRNNTAGAVPVSWTGSGSISPGAMTAPVRSAMLQIIRRLWEHGQHVSVAFKAFDTDGDGKISADELHQGLAKLGAKIDRQQLIALAGCYDRNLDGGLDINEFVALIVDFNQALQARFRWNVSSSTRRSEELCQRIVLRTLETNMSLVDLFSSFDQDGNGLLSLQEIGQGLQHLGIGIAVDEMMSIMSAFDRNGDGQLDVNEWIAMLTKLNDDMQKRFRNNVLRCDVQEAPQLPGSPSRHTSTIMLPAALHRVMRDIVFRCMQFDRPLVQVFDCFRRAQQFSLNAAELAFGLDALGVHVSLEEAVWLGRAYDTNDDGILDMGEFLRMVADMNQRLQRAFQWNLMSIKARRTGVIERIMQFIDAQGGGINLVNIFRKLDVDCDQRISAAEFARGLESMGIHLPVGEIRLLFTNADKTTDGSLHLAEFCDLVKQMSDEVERVMAMATDG
eukprot:TRINITY_DN9056_c0_g1_i1.p1 TRINITY_DN9056_c0_g1~~TRINITY_DN9056_c0_g1_i1.p1  ORF type:complete len:753 (+),score=293.84 TRINITY_DN9056_c0_g1_i1:113-2371(+)